MPTADQSTIAGLGESRLLGVFVPAGHEAQALTYLRTGVAAKHLVVTVSAACVPEKGPLVTIRLEDGSELGDENYAAKNDKS